MKKLVTYVTNVDEDVAEKAYRSSIDIIAKSMPNVLVNLKSIDLEPYDDYRGIVASFEFSYVDVKEDKQRRASMSIQDSIAALIKMHLWYVTTLNVISEPGVLNAKGKK